MVVGGVEAFGGGGEMPGEDTQVCLEDFFKVSRAIRNSVVYFSFLRVVRRETDRQAGLFQTWAFFLSKPLRVLQRADGMFLPSEIDEIEIEAHWYPLGLF